MEHDLIISALSNNSKTFEGLFSNISHQEAFFRESENKWCLVEIACHLHDEEREDFRARLQCLLENPHEKFSAIDPEGWVSSRKYLDQDIASTVGNFLNERKHSVEWLRSLKFPNWKSTYEHPKFGPLSAEMFLANWLAHDYLHIRQITRVRYQFLKKNASEVSLNYAGQW